MGEGLWGGGAEGLECSCCPHHPLGAGIWTGATSGPDPRVGAHGVGSGTPLSVASTPAWRRGGRGPHRPGSQLPGELPVAILPCKGMLPEGIWVSVGFLTLTTLFGHLKGAWGWDHRDLSQPPGLPLHLPGPCADHKGWFVRVSPCGGWRRTPSEGWGQCPRRLPCWVATKSTQRPF